MFLCDDCLRKSYSNAPSIKKSAGACEICFQIRVCSDIPSMMLSRKRPRPRKRSAKNAALDARARVRAQARPHGPSPLERMETALKDED
jgi:hypothetical protein